MNLLGSCVGCILVGSHSPADRRDQLAEQRSGRVIGWLTVKDRIGQIHAVQTVGSTSGRLEWSARAGCVPPVRETTNWDAWDRYRLGHQPVLSSRGLNVQSGHSELHTPRTSEVSVIRKKPTGGSELCSRWKGVSEKDTTRRPRGCWSETPQVCVKRV